MRSIIMPSKNWGNQKEKTEEKPKKKKSKESEE